LFAQNVKKGENMSITPGQLSENLGVPASTLRRWSNRFAKFLTPQPVESGRHREYSNDDLETFRQIRDFAAKGNSLKTIENLLTVVDRPAQETSKDEPPQPDNAGSALLVVGGLSRELGNHSNKIENIQTQLDLANKRLAALTEWLSLPWYKRIGKRPPIIY